MSDLADSIFNSLQRALIPVSPDFQCLTVSARVSVDALSSASRKPNDPGSMVSDYYSRGIGVFNGDMVIDSYDSPNSARPDILTNPSRIVRSNAWAIKIHRSQGPNTNLVFIYYLKVTFQEHV